MNKHILSLFTLLITATAQATLVAHLEFENNLNNSGSGPATITPDTSVTYAAGLFGNALDVNSATADEVTLDAGALNITSLSITTWVKFESDPAFDALFSYETASTHFMNLEVWTGGTAMFDKNGLGGSTSLTTGELLTDGDWHHVAWVGDAGTHFLYIDGVLRDSDTWTPATTLIDIQIGSSAQDDREVNALIDDFRVYDTALSAGAISSLAAVPEASTLVLTGLSILLLSLFRKNVLKHP